MTPYSRDFPELWRRAVRAEVFAASADLSAHIADVEKRLVRLISEKRRDSEAVKAIQRNLADHSLLGAMLDSVLETTARWEADLLGAVVRAIDLLQMAELRFALHRRRLAGIVRELGGQMDPDGPTEHRWHTSSEAAAGPGSTSR